MVLLHKNKIMASILVTGGCGFIGSHTIVDLIQNGYHCISVDNYLNSDPSILDQIFEITGVRVQNYAEDLTDEDAIDAIFKNHEIEGIIHFAALKAVGESVEKPLLYYKNNIGGMISLLECAVRHKVKHLLFSSSCTVYGESTDLPVTEISPIQRASSPYGYTKQVCERIIEDVVLDHEMNAAHLRYFNPAGAHDSLLLGESPINPPLNLIPIITEVGIGKREKLIVFGQDYKTRDGSCVRDYIHVMDLADAHTKALQHLMDGSVVQGQVEIFNLGTGEGTTVLEAIKAYENVSGKKLPVQLSERRAGDVPAIFADFGKAKSKLGWVPKKTIYDIMDSAWKWEQKQATTEES